MIELSNRKKTKTMWVGNVAIGGDALITVQSMTNTDTRKVKETIRQIKELEEAGCDIVRLAIPDMEAARAVKSIKESIQIPLVADIHFDYRLALECIRNGVDKIRINPGNIGEEERVREVAQMAKSSNVPIRIGVNAGSLEKDLLNKYGSPCPEAMVESAIHNINLLEKYNFDNIAVSLKASSVPMTIEAYRLMSQKTTYPLHIGVTEAGTIYKGIIKSAIGIGTLLAEGIGDTLRVSLTDNPVEEVKAGKEILKALNLITGGIELISCPTCGRCQMNMIPIAKEIERLTTDIKQSIKIAVMGCAVNGPGEAKEADIGIAGGKDCALLFRKGQIVRKIPENSIVEELLKEINNLCE